MNAPQKTKTCPQCGNSYDAEQRFCPRDGSTLRAPPGSDMVGSVIADRYLILSRIGEGGMGQVYLAEHVKMKRKSAVKVMHQGMVHDQDAIQRFNREASNASAIQHPNVAAIYDFGETADGLIYLAMEFVDGEPLTKIIERQGALTALRAAEITRQTADALEAAHEMGIVHRDLKPDNIMIARGRVGEDVVKVVDFGIAKAMTNTEQKVTKTGLAIGTPEYMSPEQLGGDQLDSRTDIYSLGLVAFNMFTGQLPFPAVTSRESLIMRLTEKPRTLKEIRHDIQWPEEMQWVMDRALSSHPGERYQHVSQFGRDLVKAVSAMPQSALSQQGTLAISAVPEITVPNSRTEARRWGRTGTEADADKSPSPAGGTASARRPSAVMRGAERGTQELTEPVNGKENGKKKQGNRGGLYAVLVVLAVAAAGGGYWFVTQRSNASIASARAGAAATTKDSLTRLDSLSRLALAEHDRRDSIARADSAAKLAADSADKTKSATKGRLSPIPPPADVEALFAPVRDDIENGKQRMEDGEYEMAVVRLSNAQDQLLDIARKYPDLAPIKSLKKEITDAVAANRAACKAEREDAIQRGTTPPECP